VFIGDTYFKQTSLLLSADTANTFISDSSTNNFLVSRFGDTKPSRFSPYWPGGWSGYFDGTGDYLSIASPGAKLTTGPFTIEGWIYLTSGGAYRQFIENAYWQAGSNGGYRVTITSSDKVDFSASAGTYNSFPIVLTSNSTVTTNAWNHIAIVRNTSNVITCYINGLSSNSVSYSSSLNLSYGGESQSTRIGGQIADATLYFPWIGWINSVRVVNGSAIYTANFTPNISSITTVANTSLLTLRDSILADDSPNNFTITRNGDTKLTTFSPFNTAPYTFTANSNSVYFDGTGDYLTVADNAAFELGSNNFTLETWVLFNVLPSSNGYQATFFSKWATSNASYEFYLYNNAGTYQLYLTYSTNGTATTNLGVNWTPSVGIWYHIACVRNSSNLTFYVNGLQQGTVQSISGTLYNGSGALELGGFNGGGANTILNGYLSNSRLVNGTALYTANFTPSTTALTAVANTSLLTCQSTTVVDNSSNNFAITVNGNPNVSIVNPFGDNVSTISNYTWSANSYSASAYFDGTGDYIQYPNSTEFQFGTGNFTIEFWWYPTTLAATQPLVYHTNDNFVSGTGEFSIVYNTSLGLRFYINAGATTVDQGSTTGWTINQWYHVAAVRNSNTLTLYRNGIVIASGSVSGVTIGANVTTQVMGESYDPLYSTGYMSNFRVVKRALYTGPFVPPAAPLTAVANTSILTLQTDIGSNSVQFVDQSAQNNLITRNGNASQGAYSPLVPSTWSAYFDGTGDYLTVASNAAFIFGSGDFTVECWVYAFSLPADVMLITKWNAGLTAGTNQWILYLASGVPSFVWSTDGTNPSIAATGSTITVNTWNHIAAVRSGNSITVYVNGVGGTAQSVTGSLYTLETEVLGISYRRNNGSTQNPLTGYLSNLRILKGTAQYTANFTPATTTISPIANTSLLTLREPILADNSGNNFTITRNGDTKIVPFGPFSPQTVTPDSYSYRFSNASDYISTTNSNLALGTNDWTVESWVYPRFTANSGIFQISNVQYGLTNSNLNTVALGFSSGNKAIVRVANASYTSTGTSITANAWTHLALVKSSNVSKLYINGTLDSTIGTSGSITDTVNYTGTTNIAVGGYGSTSALANAYISNFRVVSNSAVYTQNFTVNTGPISAISGTTLLTCQANTIVDGSLANLTITANANVTPSKFNPFDETVTVGQTYSGASAGGSAYFDGSGDYLQTAASSGTALVGGQLTSTSTLTIECWVYHISYITGTVGIIIGDFTPAAGINYWSFGTNSSGNAVFFWYDGASKLATGNTVIPLQSWAHIAVSISAGSINLFVNGQKQTITGTSTLTTTTGTLGYLSIGQYNTSTGFTGYISNLRILKSALYTSSFIPSTTAPLPTTANTSLLLNFTNSGVVDATGRNVLETVNDSRVTTSLSKYGSGSYYFDGTGDYMYVMGTSSEMAFGTGDFTVEFWVYPAAANQTATIIDWRPTNTNGAYPMLYLSSGSIKLYVNTADQISGGAVTASAWSHIALARSSGVTKLFLNGTQTGSNYTDTNAYLTGSGRPLIGSNAYDLLLPFNGYLDDLRITKGYARYTANFTAPTAPFVTK
jgi:hypothetical protein